jgi:hypothetical protein
MVASHSRELPDSRRIHFGLVIGIIALVIVKGFKRYLAKNNTIKIKYYQLMMTIQQIETDNLFIN